MLADEPQRASTLAELLKAVAHPLRLRILAILCQGDAYVNTMAERLQTSQALVSQQLRILRMSRLVDVNRERGFALYTLVEPHMRDMIACLEQCER